MEEFSAIGIEKTPYDMTKLENPLTIQKKSNSTLYQQKFPALPIESSILKDVPYNMKRRSSMGSSI